ncbi:unnamed protein product, partial [Owenia fusiformis]
LKSEQSLSKTACMQSPCKVHAIFPCNTHAKHMQQNFNSFKKTMQHPFKSMQSPCNIHSNPCKVHATSIQIHAKHVNPHAKSMQAARNIVNKFHAMSMQNCMHLHGFI